VLDGLAPDTLLDTYDAERLLAADENILNSTRSTDFISPKNRASRVMRDAVLALAERHPFARSLVNSGRLSQPAIYRDSPLNTPDLEEFACNLRPGAPCADAPVAIDGESSWLVDSLGRTPDFAGLLFDDGGTATVPPAALAGLANRAIGVRTLVVTRTPGLKGTLYDCDGHAFRRYDARHGTFYLVRPDQHVAARWRNFDTTAVVAALARTTGN
jgi:3-(3-hydroxy-phenyl)propionate hydroxylase